MGWFDSLSNFFTSDAGLAAGVLGVANIASNLISSSANNKAAERVAQGYEASAAAQREGNAAAQRRFDQLQEQTAPAMSYLRGVYADPNALTPLQRQQYEEMQRTTANKLATSGLRGAGRSLVAAQRAVESDFVNRAVDSNQRRADSAATQQANVYSNAVGNSARIDQQNGAVTGNALAEGSEVGANADLANAGNTTRAISDLSGFIANEVKGRKSRQQAAAEG